MYVTTFYSFKGGVGRTFALVNVALELAKAGRNVLLVDFDLEAPGIHTFGTLSPREPHSGVVEYVSQYIATGISPDARHFVYETKEAQRRGATGRIWVMPAGRGDYEYRNRLLSINWQELYAKHDGYLMFEDLKAQWENAFAPDYVLIDSRTGHTDIEGICTRQLPDAVAILFFPNEQNLRGLREVVQDIASETNRSRKDLEPVTLHFIMSNVPDLDDEDDILRGRINDFRHALQCDSIGVIHNYPSLALLNQTIFTLERPKSRLAREYRKVTRRIVDGNDDDVDGAIRFLRDYETPQSRFGQKKFARPVQRLDSIEKKHSRNGEVRFLLGLIRKGQGCLAEALSHFSSALKHGHRESACLVERATCHAMMGNRELMTTDIKRLIELPELSRFELQRAIELLRGRNNIALLRQFAQSAALERFDPDTRFMLANAIYDMGGAEVSVRLLERVIDDPQASPALIAATRGRLVLALIAAADFSGAMKLISVTRPNPADLAIESAFNYAMAEWAETGQLPLDMFARVIEVAEARRDPKSDSANFNQCLAISLWAVGRVADAAERLELAKSRALENGPTEFSCWRYHEVSRAEFLEDCEAVRNLLVNDEGRPLFFPIAPTANL